MRPFILNYSCCLLAFLFLSLSISVYSQPSSFPVSDWMQYVDPEDAGFDTDKLNAVKDKFIENGGSSLMVIREGYVVSYIGPVDRCYRQTSVRKSYLNALYGIFVDRGDIDLNASLASLNIDDTPPLNDNEKRATVLQLLQSRSGIYHTAAYSPEWMEKQLPERGSHAPGTYWFYNNWDFNALATIFKQQTHRDMFEAFQEYIAQPTGMQDYDLQKTKYLFEDELSQHPAYIFRMSPRDMARFGLLYLNNGAWEGEQIIHESWIEISWKRHSVNGTNEAGVHWDDYGLLWWISNTITKEPVYYASGSGLQRISIFPESDMVMVHVVDNYQMKSVNEDQVDELTKMLLDAKTGKVKKGAKLQELTIPEDTLEIVTVDEGILKKFVGEYQNPMLGTFKIYLEEDHLLMQAGIGDFVLKPFGENEFFNKDIRIPMYFIQDSVRNDRFFIAKISEKGIIQQFIFYY
ncbi:MAG TPA: serine hydrolase [Cytophagales bacterium]|jgi:CubicO group peptidase (beta-lactamase class C family)|nr:serine hydrolase [Cytophagales bacterium]